MQNRMIFLICGVLAASVSIHAEPQSGKEQKDRSQRARLQAQNMAEKLSLNEEKTALLIEAYDHYRQEIHALGPRVKRTEDMTEQQMEELLLQRLDRSARIIDIRRKYYEEYRNFLSPSQIESLYAMERRDMHRTAKKNHASGSRHKGRKR